MKISVVVPSYNRADLLPATLDAILAQTFPAHEIIVVDDGSNDDTVAMLQRYQPRVRAMPIANSGDLVARNIGLGAASGDLVAFCDSDDLWMPTFLETMTGLWRREPQLTAAYSNFVILQGDTTGTTSKFDTAPAGFWDGAREFGPDMLVFDTSLIERLIRYQPFFASCIIVNRIAFRAHGGWDEAASRIVGSDFATALRVAEHPPIGVVSRPLVAIRKHAGNFSADVQAMNLGDAEVLEIVMSTRPSLAPYGDQIRASIVRRRRDAFDIAFARRDFAAARAIYPRLGEIGRTPNIRIKYYVASMPCGLRDIVAASLLRLGSLRSGQ